MNNQTLATLIFAIIFLGNLILAIWNCLQGNYTEAMISGVIVLLIIVWFFVDRRKR